ncbi:hypothetical protein O7627_01680 [Solwaraspora sp. WMMD1047]|uniref:hypothetical protein n=1 Tax=Solwaraspora sp. WMMD1047 TaxID=3016102 RepID=UPI002416C479|nr:hypothetical protein [Solwaraspora sp. WMMD1047]MDG4828011.1 hypothetical protein [Solwaraspora sp. WMMD1047]
MLRHRLPLIALLAIAVVPVTAAEPARAAAQPSPEPSPAVATIGGTARCDVNTGQWSVTWTTVAWSTGLSIVSMRDEVNDFTYQQPQNPYPTDPAGSLIAAGLLLPGAARTASLTVTFTGPAGAESITREMSWTVGCQQRELPACVPVGQDRYTHSFDPGSTVATVEIDGAPACTNAGITFHSAVGLPAGQFRPVSYRFAGLGGTSAEVYDKVVLFADTPSCSSRRILAFGSPLTAAENPNQLLGSTEAPGNRSTGPVIADVRGQGACIDVTVQEASVRVRTGPRTQVPAIRLTVSNDADAVLPAAFAVLYGATAGGTRLSFHQAEPGETATVVVGPGEQIQTIQLWWDVTLTPEFEMAGPGYTWTAPPTPPRRPGT